MEKYIMFWDYVYARYRSEYDRITVIHHDFVEATQSSFWKITVSHSTVIPNRYIKNYI
jgi:hypothetical protein